MYKYNYNYYTQDQVNLLYKPESAADRGTLYQLKQDFDHRQMKKKVTAAFNYAWDLVKV
jgi:hypothetical protein